MDDVHGVKRSDKLMRLRICAVGRLRRGPELALIEDYIQRFDRTGRQLGLGPLAVFEVDDRKSGGIAHDAKLLQKAAEGATVTCALDERGETLTSPALAERLSAWQDAGHRDAAFLIGGADGLEPSLRDGADIVLSFGPMVWPHILARVMLTEQLYRAATILAGSPYHRA